MHLTPKKIQQSSALLVLKKHTIYPFSYYLYEVQTKFTKEVSNSDILRQEHDSYQHFYMHTIKQGILYTFMRAKCKSKPKNNTT